MVLLLSFHICLLEFSTKMFPSYSSNDVAAYEEVDGTHQGFSGELTSKQRIEAEMQSIIRLAHQEQEAHTHQQVISAMKKREEELAKLRDIKPFPKSLTRTSPSHEEEIRLLLDRISSKEDSGNEDDEDF
ncbi:uncharacterized protein LOC108032519 [Drosophila biarmipes]|uniref:uncharacterized protein LOC108032519 n=1 Tax=Drosophila biarmipes TaxID=125945 RepID=UPI0007E7798D|nr:uncharacterized protein LOC108032519 [Drosophila biarmipes]